MGVPVTVLMSSSPGIVRVEAAARCDLVLEIDVEVTVATVFGN
jgi:hypothetical protein